MVGTSPRRRKVVQRGCVLRVGKGRVAVGHHDDAMIEHHGVACSRFAAYVSHRAGVIEELDAAAFQSGVDIRRARNERAVFVLLDAEIGEQSGSSRG